MAQIEIISEKEFAGGWAFDVQVLDDAGALSKHRVTLSWADYNLWSADGADEPARVIEAVMLFVSSQTPPHDLAEKFDASTIRRRFAEADLRIPKMIRR